jgi:hypothetical protein
MGWHCFGKNQQGITGDEPFDVAQAAAERMARVYIDRFGRPPLLAEMLHALRVAIGARAQDLLYDPERLETDWPQPRLPDVAPLDLDAYEAVWSERPEPDGAYYLIERATGTNVLQCSLRVDRRTLFVDYERLLPEPGDTDVQRLVLYTLVRDLLRDTYADEASRVSIAAASSPTERTDFAFPVG